MVLSVDRFVGKVSVITGAASGIGAATAEKLVEQGVNVVGFDINVNPIKENAEKLVGKKGKLYAVKVDVTKEEDVLNGFSWTSENVGPVHILVNSAGIVTKDTLCTGKTENWRKVIDVNVLGLCITTREAIRIMRENDIDGHIIHINSIQGHTVKGVFHVYPATKHAVTALSETLRLELNSFESKIKVTSISPAGVDTPIHTEEARKTELFKKVHVHMLKPEDIAEAILYALSTPPHVQIKELMVYPVNARY